MPAAITANPPPETLRIEDYGLIGDLASAALVGRNGSIDWLCLPRFDSAACFASLLGTPEHGRWLIAPDADITACSRAYRDGGLVLETRFSTQDGEVMLVDFMVPNALHPTLIRRVVGLRGQVRMRMDLALRFDFGSAVPWVTRLEGRDAEDGRGFRAIVGPDMVVLRTPVELEGRDMRTVASFEVAEGESLPFVLRHGPSHLPLPPNLDVMEAEAATDRFWSAWCGSCGYEGPWQAEVRRSLLVLKALTFLPTGGIVAAPTTSLPESIGGARNWDYRYCWLRDATLTLFAFMLAGFGEEAQAWADWLQRSVAGSPEQVQIMYGIAGERRMDEWVVPWLPGYENSHPVRIGNAAATQLQLDVYGEVVNALHEARVAGFLKGDHSWSLQRQMVEHLETIWEQPDEGLWETRGGRRHFTFSKVMCWVAVDRAIRDAEQHGLEAPLDRWRTLRDHMHATICEKGIDPARGCFVQSYGDTALDASCLLISEVGFLPHKDPRVVATVNEIERELLVDGFVLRYRTEQGADGLAPGEGAFLACSFWLASALHRQGRTEDGKRLFERVLGTANDLGLLAEEYDPRLGRQVGNFPQAFSHVGLVICAMRLGDKMPDRHRHPRSAGAVVA